MYNCLITNRPSDGGRALATALGCFYKNLKRNDRPITRDININWGCSSIPDNILRDRLILNRPQDVAMCSNKLRLFQHMEGTGFMPSFTTDLAVATTWTEQRSRVVCRTTLTGHSGEGIVIASTADQLVPAPLYVKYVRKAHEFRVHVMHGKAIHVQRKARRAEVPDDQVNWQVRNLAGGFVYANEENEAGQQYIELKRSACSFAEEISFNLALDFGAYDIIYNERYNMFHLLEINTAPGLSSETALRRWATAFINSLPLLDQSDGYLFATRAVLSPELNNYLGDSQ